MKAVVREDTFNILLQARSKEKTNGGGGRGRANLLNKTIPLAPSLKEQTDLGV